MTLGSLGRKEKTKHNNDKCHSVSPLLFQFNISPKWRLVMQSCVGGGGVSFYGNNTRQEVKIIELNSSLPVAITFTSKILSIPKEVDGFI